MVAPAVEPKITLYPYEREYNKADIVPRASDAIPAVGSALTRVPKNAE